jgi:hypothetical protein
MVIKLGVEEWVGTGTSFVGKETLRCFMHLKHRMEK